jgi:hypothetical protein
VDDLTEHLPGWYSAVVKKAKSFFYFVTCKTYVQVDMKDRDEAWLDKVRRCLKNVDNTAILWPRYGSGSWDMAKKFNESTCRWQTAKRKHVADDGLLAVMEQEDGATFVLVTEDPVWDKNGYWWNVVETQPHVSAQIVRYGRTRRASHGGFERFKEALDAAYLGEPVFSFYYPAEPPLSSKQQDTISDTASQQQLSPQSVTVNPATA